MTEKEGGLHSFFSITKCYFLYHMSNWRTKPFFIVYSLTVHTHVNMWTFILLPNIELCCSKRIPFVSVYMSKISSSVFVISRLLNNLITFCCTKQVGFIWLVVRASVLTNRPLLGSLDLPNFSRYKGQISLYLISKILYQTLCVFSQINDRKYIKREFHSTAWVMPQGRDLWVLGGDSRWRLFDYAF